MCWHCWISSSRTYKHHRIGCLAHFNSKEGSIWIKHYIMIRYRTKSIPRFRWMILKTSVAVLIQTDYLTVI